MDGFDDAPAADGGVRYPSVGMLHAPSVRSDQAGLCTATLITPNHLLTAAHCLGDWDGSFIDFYVGYHPGTALPTDPPSVLLFETPIASVVRPEACTIHPDYFHGQGCGEAAAAEDDILFHFSSDVGVVRLPQRPIPVSWSVAPDSAGGLGRRDFHPMIAESLAATVEVGDAITIVGYGLEDPDDSDLATFGFRRYRSGAIGALEFRGVPGLVYSGVGGTAPGDSGGPALWDDAPAGAGYEWPRPPVGLASVAAPGRAGNLYASLAEPANLRWVWEQIDSDGDGRYDTFVGGRRCGPGFDPRATPDNDRDGDGVLDVDDNCTLDDVPSAHLAYNPCQDDRDFDGVGDNCDTCPDEWNPGAAQHADRDMDRVPDACDNCPFHANDDQADDDPVPGETGDFVERGDGVGDGCDNCAGVYNPGQSNCNADAELAAGRIEPGVVGGGVGVGDACDPIPCGDTELGVGDGIVERGGLSFVVTGGPTVEVDALASEERTERTGFRFCRCSLAREDTIETRLACIAELDDDEETGGGCAIPDNDTYDITEREPDTWRLTTQDGDDLRHEPVLVYDARMDGFDPDLIRTWDLDGDVDRWSTSFGEFYSRDALGNLFEPVRGVLWTRTPGPETGPSYPTGSDEWLLAHHYTSGPVRGRFTARVPFPCYDFVAPLLSDRSLCPTCAQSFPSPWIGSPGTAGFPAFPPCLADPLEPPGIVIPGALLEAGPSFATDPAPLLAVDGRWVAASEPGPWLPKGGLRYAAVLPDGTLERLLVQTPTGLAAPGLQPVEPFGVATAAGDAGDAPVAVLSARRQLLWVFFESTIRIVDLRSGAQRELDVHEEPLGHVLAAGYDPASDSLAVLDEVTAAAARPGRGGGRRTARLLRMEPLTGEIAVVRSWPRVAPTDRFALAADPRGGLWVVASGDRGAHVVLAFRAPWTAGRIVGWRTGSGVLAQAAARGSRRGVSIAVTESDGSAVIGHRWADLRPPSHAAAARCF